MLTSGFFVMKIKPLLRLLRPKQWVKNAFVLAPLLFSGGFKVASSIENSLLAFLIFCVASSSTYLLNDLKDVDQDRLHPTKSKSRPIASGEVSKSLAIATLIFCYFILLGSFWIMPAVVKVAGIYIGVNYLYTFWLKHEPVTDIFVISLGFIFRVFAGTQAVGVTMSSWIFITTLCLALYLASVKRRQELLSNGSKSRKVLQKYSVSLVDRYAEMSATGALIFYSMYVMDERPQLILSIPIVLYGLFRYWYVVEQTGGGESPTDSLFEDRQLLLTIFVWVGFCSWVLMRG